MNAEMPPVVAGTSEDRRQIERRSDWHTPDDCFKLLDVQRTMDSIFGQLEEGRIRMGCMEDNIAGNHRITSEDIKSLEKKLDENSRATEENRQATAEALEIIRMGEGLFKAVRFTGKWIRKIIMWVVPPVLAIVGLWQALMDKTR
jgi:hypothetical protein